MRPVLILILFMGMIFSFSLSAQKKGEISSTQILRSLPRELPGGEFFLLGLRTGKKGEGVSFYRGPSGMLLNLELAPLETPPVKLENAHKAKLKFTETLKDAKGKKVPAGWLVTRQALSFPGLAGKTLSGIRMQAKLGKGKGAGRLDLFLAVYRERLLQISFLLPEGALPAKAQERIFNILLSQVAQMLYEGEKATLTPFRKKIFFEAFDKLMQEPENAAMQCHAITKFVERSSAVIVRIDHADFPWQKELLESSPEGRRAFALLLTAFMGGNAAEQLKSGVCADRKAAGMAAMKKMYLLLRQKKILSIKIPELEK